MDSKNMLSSTVDKNIWLKIKRLAFKEGISANKYLVIVIENYIKQYEKEHGVINTEPDK